jgi:hypothetical protein
MPYPKVSGGTYTTEDGGDFYTTEGGDPLISGDAALGGGILYRLHSAIGDVQEQTWNDALSILDSAIADNANFTIDDANDWYRRLGIYNSGTVALADMMAAINQKLNYPGEQIYGRSHYQFIEDQLQAAGFNVRVYENRFPLGPGWITKSPYDILGGTTHVAQYGMAMYGSVQYGQLATSNVTKAVQYLEESKDALYEAYLATAYGYRNTFYISGYPINTFATVPAARKTEFRQLLLQLKPLQMCGFCFINYA